MDLQKWIIQGEHILLILLRLRLPVRLCLQVHESGHVFIQATWPALNHLLVAEGDI